MYRKQGSLYSMSLYVDGVDYPAETTHDELERMLTETPSSVIECSKYTAHEMYTCHAHLGYTQEWFSQQYELVRLYKIESERIQTEGKP